MMLTNRSTDLVGLLGVLLLSFFLFVCRSKLKAESRTETLNINWPASVSRCAPGMSLSSSGGSLL